MFQQDLITLSEMRNEDATACESFHYEIVPLPVVNPLSNTIQPFHYSLSFNYEVPFTKCIIRCLKFNFNPWRWSRLEFNSIFFFNFYSTPIVKKWKGKKYSNYFRRQFLSFFFFYEYTISNLSNCAYVYKFVSRKIYSFCTS